MLKRRYLTLSTGSDAEASGVGGARPPRRWRQLAVSYSFLRHLGKENVAKNAKGQQMLRTKAVSYTLLDQFMAESRFSGPWQSFSNPLASRASVLKML